jgi:outer membrane immunogenic protein
MKMMRVFCAMWIALVVLPVAASAQSVTQNTAWNGYYLGVNVGGRFSSNDWLTSLACPNTSICAGGQVGPDFKQTFDSTAVRVGAFGGHNWSLGSSFIAGVEADIGWANNRNANGPIPGTTASGGVPGITNGDTAAVNLQWDASLRARVGSLIRPDTLLFATAGVALQQVEMVATCRNDGTNATYCTQPQGVWHYDSQTRWMPGWTIGAGLEHMLAGNWLLRLEYRYADFGQANPTFFANNIGGNGDDRVFTHIWVKTHTVSLGAAYKF